MSLNRCEYCDGEGSYEIDVSSRIFGVIKEEYELVECDKCNDSDNDNDDNK